MFNTIVYQAPQYRILRFSVGLGPVRSPFDAASLVVVALLALLFAAAIVGALQPAHFVDPMLAVVEGGL